MTVSKDTITKTINITTEVTSVIPDYAGITVSTSPNNKLLSVRRAEYENDGFTIKIYNESMNPFIPIEDIPEFCKGLMEIYESRKNV